MKDRLPGGKGDNRPDSDFDPKWLAAGIKVESEHTDDPAVAKEIAKDHLTEDPLYYKKLRKIEKSMDEEIAMLKAAELTGPHGGHYHLTKQGGKVYTGKAAPRAHAQVVQNIKTATKAAMHSMRAGKIGHYEKARQFLSRYDNHSDPQVRRVLSAAHDVLHRSAKAMIGKSKTAKAAHIYTLISKHHNDKVNVNLPATMNKAKVDKTDYEPLLKESVGILQRLKSKGAHNPTHPDHAGYKSELRSLKFNMEKHTKQQLHLEKRRNKKGVVVGKWVGAKKTPKKPGKKQAKKTKKSAPKAPKKPKKTAMKKPAAKKVSKKKADYKKSDMYKLQIALDSVMKNPAQNQEKSDKLNWKLIEHALKQGDDKDVSRALKHVQEVMK